MRIVSLLPSATEIVCAVGLGDDLVAVTHECDFPPQVARLPKVTRSAIPRDASSAEIDRLVRERLQNGNALYTLDMPLLKQLRPELIVTQALCDVCAVAEDEVRAAADELPERPRIVNLEPQRLGEVLQSMRQVAEAAGANGAADQLIAQLQRRIDAVAAKAQNIARRPRVALLEWLDPPFCSGHWNPELVRLAGGEEGLGREGVPSRTLRWEEVIAWQPEVVVIACCGFDIERTKRDLPLLDKVAGWRELPAVRDGKVTIADGSQYFNRPGPRLVDSLEIVARAIQASGAA
ncbi:MAG TPA: ABC transporter substrate-binding protein [Pirellulales bacterium]|jgi:iron complex transport system substrate-binding protein|nr:ABC transporter substrate-binding protein [Pirellulales bacterium]